MIGENAFCPKTGAPLSDERHYDDQGHPQRAPIEDCVPSDIHSDGELTTGAIRSSRTAVFNYFRWCHQRHNTADQSFYRKALLGIRRLKRTATGKQDWDIHLWYALQHWLATEFDYETDWMDAHAEPRCLHCHGRLKYDETVDGTVYAQCGANCTGNHMDQLPVIRETIARLYSQAFDDPSVEETDFLQFS